MDEDDDHYGSIVLGISDALIEMTGVLAGLTFALKDLKLVALSGLVTGIAASLSICLLYTSPSPRDRQKSRMPSSA